jgi:hypothetical protein
VIITGINAEFADNLMVIVITRRFVMVIVCLPEFMDGFWWRGKQCIEYDSYLIDEDLYDELIYSESYGRYEVCD